MASEPIPSTTSAAPAMPPVATAPVPAATPVAPASAPPVFELPPAIYSPALLESVIYDLQYYLDWTRQNQIRKTVGAKAKEEPSHSAETVLVIKAWQGNAPATLDSLEQLLAYLRGLKLPEIHIMLAALPNHAQRETIVSWFHANVSPRLLLSFVADRNLGGGLVVRTPNRVFDYTWKQQLVAGRSKMAEILKRV
ncbi:MAG TPA: hypothetical protein VMT30_03270 [Candidatus Saccharimonadia bacterium]|nr:hypothetical protein [Candidatus Saccharimonadia bacterium]